MCSSPPPDASHLFRAHQKANRLASVVVGSGVDDVALTTWRAGAAVRGQAGQGVLGAVVLSHLMQIPDSAVAAKLKGEQRLQLGAFDGAQQDHRL